MELIIESRKRFVLFHFHFHFQANISCIDCFMCYSIPKIFFWPWQRFTYIYFLCTQTHIPHTFHSHKKFDYYLQTWCRVYWLLLSIRYSIFDISTAYLPMNEWMVCEWFHCNEGRKSLKFLEKGCTISYISADEKNERFSQRDRKFQFRKFGWNSRFTDVMNGPYYYFFGIHILYNEFD